MRQSPVAYASPRALCCPVKSLLHPKAPAQAAKKALRPVVFLPQAITTRFTRSQTSTPGNSWEPCIAPAA